MNPDWKTYRRSVKDKSATLTFYDNRFYYDKLQVYLDSNATSCLHNLAPFWVSSLKKKKTFCQLTIDMFTLSSSYKWLLLFSAICQFWLGICFAKTTFKNQSIASMNVKEFCKQIWTAKKEYCQIVASNLCREVNSILIDHWCYLFFKYLPQILLMLSQKITEVTDSFICENIILIWLCLRLFLIHILIL